MKANLDLLQFIKENLDKGETAEEIASLVGCSEKEIKDLQKKYDIYINEDKSKDDMKEIKRNVKEEEKKKTLQLVRYVNGLTKQEADYVMSHKNETLVEGSDYAMNLCDILLTRELNYMKQDCEADDDFTYKVHKTLQQTPVYDTIFLGNGEEHKVQSLKKQLLNSAIEEFHISKKDKRDKYLTSILKIMQMKEKFARLRIDAMKYVKELEKQNLDGDAGLKTIYVVPDNQRNKNSDNLDSYEELEQDMTFYNSLYDNKESGDDEQD